jgi:hypothetical protein
VVCQPSIACCWCPTCFLCCELQGPPPGGRPGPPLGPPQQPAQELTKTATIRNRANLKKNTLRLVPLGGDPTKLLITFVFDNSAPCMCVLAAPGQILPAVYLVSIQHVHIPRVSDWHGTDELL